MNKIITSLFIGDGKQIERRSAFWNMMFSGINALQSAIMLLMVTRLCGAEAGGIFAIAYTTSQLMYTVGSYSFRNFHATDTNNVYTYCDYRRARVMTCCGMVMTSVLYCLLRQYDPKKSAVVLAACAYRLIEAVEDLDHGELQRRGHLDVAGREGTLRILICDALFLWLLLVVRNALVAIIGTAVTALLITQVAHKSYGPFFESDHPSELREKGKRLLSDCFPLFAAGCLSMYNTNAAKYAIDACLGSEAQTYYSVIFMPVFTINLLSGMVFRPRLKRMSEFWNSRAYGIFRRMVLQQVAIIAVLTAAITMFGIFAGLRLLGILYGLELSNYTTQFAILLVGGGLSAFYSYMECCLTVMRRQKALLILGCVVVITALVASRPLVSHYGLVGACWSYLLLMLIEVCGSVAAFTWCCKHRKAEYC